MKKLFLLPLLFLSLITKAQYKSEYNWDFDYSYYMYATFPKSYELPKGTTTLTYSVTQKNGKQKEYKDTYNQEGKLLSHSAKSKTGNYLPVIEYYFD